METFDQRRARQTAVDAWDLATNWNGGAPRHTHGVGLADWVEYAGRRLGDGATRDDVVFELVDAYAR